MSDIPMQPQPIWEESPSMTKTGTWAGQYRFPIHGYNGIEEGVDEDEHSPPSPMHRPVYAGGQWVWTTDPE